MKTKMIAMVEIAIVLCSLFLVAIPAVAAEQNQAMQKVSTNEVTTASEDDYVLDIYGNANEDDTIDMGDVVYTKLAIFGKKPKTELCDAKYDGRINVLDVIQTKLIILGKEKELTVIDTAERIVTVKKPLKRIIVFYNSKLEAVRLLKVPKDIIVGRTDQFDPSFFPELSDLPSVGSGRSPDIEKILNLNPDTVIVSATAKHKLKPLVDPLESAGITVLAFNCQTPEIHLEEMEKLGYVFDKEDEAEEYLDWREKILNSIQEKVETIPEEDKPKVYAESYKLYTYHGLYMYIAEAGGKDIFADEPHGSVDPEAVIARNPDIIIKAKYPGGGYDLDADNVAELKAVRDEIMSRPELLNVKAVNAGRVYIITVHLLPYLPYSGCRYFAQIAYMAKWFHPELFEDLDPKAIHQEYLTRFQGLDIDLDEKGVFVYPEPS